MKPAPFDYRRPASVEEAIELLGAGEGIQRLLAGGQSLVPMLNLRLAPVDRIIDISRISTLRSVQESPDEVRYGACVPHAWFEDGRVADCANGLLTHVAARIAYRAVRNRGTLGGSLALADPAADWAPVMVLLRAKFVLASRTGSRSVPAQEFFRGSYTTAAREDELLTAICVPRLAVGARWGYVKVTRKTGEYASSLALALIDPHSGEARVVAGAVSGPPLVLDGVAKLLGARPNDATLREAALHALDAAKRNFSSAMRHVHAATIVRAAKQVVS